MRQKGEKNVKNLQKSISTRSKRKIEGNGQKSIPTKN
jgi:hypothetical protein